MRNTFVKTLVDIAENDDQICLITGDLGFGVLTAISLYRFTGGDMWKIFISKYFVRFIWINALLFGLLHLTAFTELSIELFPYALCLSVWPFLGGCVITYIRVNIGFLHVL